MVTNVTAVSGMIELFLCNSDSEIMINGIAVNISGACCF